MDQTIEQTFASDEPLDIVEQVLMEEQHPYERDMLEVHFAIAGAWSDHQLWFAWRPDVQTLHLHLGLDIKTPPSRRAGRFRPSDASPSRRPASGPGTSAPAPTGWNSRSFSALAP